MKESRPHELITVTVQLNMIFCMLIYVIGIDISGTASTLKSFLSLDVDFVSDHP